MHLRFSRLRWPEWMMGAGALVLLGSMLRLPWYRRTPRSSLLTAKRVVPESVDGWHGLGRARWLMVGTVLMAFKVVFFQARQRAPALPVAATALAWPLASGSAVWLVVRLLIAPSARREIGGWIGLFGAAGIAYGGYRSILMEGVAATDAPAEIPTVALDRQGPAGLEREGAT